MPGEKLRLASLSVLGGSLHGRRRDVEEVVGELLVGSDPDCHLVVDLPSISPIHARLWTDLDQVEVNDTRAPRGVFVNTKRVEGRAILRPGDVLWLGPPQDPGSVCVHCRFEAWVEVLPGGAAVSGEEGEVEAGVGGAPSSLPGATQATVPPEVSGPADFAPEVEATEAPVAETVENVVVAEEGAPPASGEPDPFFVGEAEPSVRADEPEGAGEGLFTLDEASPIPSDKPVPAEPVVQDSPADASPASVSAADEWAIAEPVPTPAESLPVPDVSDEFFVSEEPATAAGAFEPEVEAHGTTPPAVPAPSAEPQPSFVDFGEFEPEPDAAPSEELVAAAPVELVPAWESPPAPPPPPSTPLPTTRIPATPAPAVPAPVAAQAAAPAASPPGPVPRAEAPPAAAPPAVAPPAAAVERARPRPATTIPKRPTTPAAARPATAAARRPSPRPEARRSGGIPSWLRPVALGVAALALLAALGFAAWQFLAGSVRVVSVEPGRVRVGQRAIVNGRGFAPDAAGNVVTFDDRRANVVSVQAERLEVEVPDVPVESGGERRVDLVVRSGSRSSAPVPVTVIQAPRVHGLSPEAALPGEEVLLAGAGWGLGATVRFGSAAAPIVAVDATSIRVVVPAEAGAVGTRAPVVVTVAGVDSNAAPFFVGRLPVVSEVAPASAMPGDTVQVTGLGFQPNAAQNDVRVGGLPALVVSATGDTMKIVVPRLPPGDAARPVEVRLPGSATVGQATLQAAAMPETLDLRFVAEPFTAGAGRSHAVVSTGLGPVFVLAASGGRSAGERAVEAARKLSSAVPALRTTLGLTFEARGYEASPTIGLAGQPDALLTVTEEDAAVYNEDWTGLGARGAPVTRARLARWWEALARDLVLVAVRGERPRFAAELAPEGRALGQLFDAVRKGGQPGIAQRTVDEARPALRDAVRLLAFRVPGAVQAPAGPPAPGLPAPTAAASAAIARMPTQGTLRGSETEEGQVRYLTVDLRGGGTIAYEGGITLTLPLSSLERGRDRLRFSVPIRGAMRYYTGKWDGEKVAGSVSSDSAGRNVVGTFELRPR